MPFKNDLFIVYVGLNLFLKISLISNETGYSEFSTGLFCNFYCFPYALVAMQA